MHHVKKKIAICEIHAIFFSTFELKLYWSRKYIHYTYNSLNKFSISV